MAMELILILLYLLSFITLGPAAAPSAIALVLPSSDSARLDLQSDGLAFLDSINGPIAPIVVLGPYRSGKSFLLNQLLNVSCSEGFGVSHRRETKTKGIWLWNEPQQVLPSEGGSPEALNVIYVDTEGFESTGKSSRGSAYDNRIFAISSCLSSLLVYNLAETIKESDVSRLSFVVDLAQGLYQQHQDHEEGESSSSFEQLSMIWLIQHDFLQGKAAGDVVKEVLSPVPNPNSDPEIEQLNTIRASLHSIARNSTGWSLPQPHLERTRLCNLTDGELNPKYVSAREGLKDLVKSLVHPKMLGGKVMTGKQLSKLIAEFVQVLNELEIPSVSSMLEVFNRELSNRALKAYREKLEAARVPMDDEELHGIEEEARGEAMKAFKHQAIGGKKKADQQLNELLAEMKKEFELKQVVNKAASAEVCDREEAECETVLDEAQARVLPSFRIFNASFQRCSAHFKRTCAGPDSVKAVYHQRLEKAYKRMSQSFLVSYNIGLHTGLVFLSLCCALFFRFFFRLWLIESIGWLGFLFLEIYPHVLLKGSNSFYQSRGWQLIVASWEALMWALFGFYGAWMIWLCLLILLLCRILTNRAKSSKKKSITRKGSKEERDLDV